MYTGAYIKFFLGIYSRIYIAKRPAKIGIQPHERKSRVFVALLDNLHAFAIFRLVPSTVHSATMELYIRYTFVLHRVGHVPTICHMKNSE